MDWRFSVKVQLKRDLLDALDRRVVRAGEVGETSAEARYIGGKSTARIFVRFEGRNKVHHVQGRDLLVVEHDGLYCVPSNRTE